MTLGESRANLPNSSGKVRLADKPGADGFVDALLSPDTKISGYSWTSRPIDAFVLAREAIT